jgi:hypothetical protein
MNETERKYRATPEGRAKVRTANEKYKRLNKEKVAATHRIWCDNNRDRRRLLNRKCNERKAEYIRELKKQPCTDCGNKYPFYQMDFDHIDASNKLFSLAAYKLHSWGKIKEEIAKCELVCCMCHRERTYNRLETKYEVV